MPAARGYPLGLESRGLIVALRTRGLGLRMKTRQRQQAINAGLVSAVSLLIASGPTRGGEPLDLVPARSASIVIIHNPADFAARLSQLVGRISETLAEVPGSASSASLPAPPAAKPEIDGDYLLRRLGLPPGSARLDAPVMLVMPRPSFDDEAGLFIFRAIDAARWDATAATTTQETEDGLRSVSVSPRRTLYATTRDGWVIAGPSRRMVRRFARSRNPGPSLSAALDEAERAVLEGSDLVIRFSIPAWIDRKSVV